MLPIIWAAVFILAIYFYLRDVYSTFDKYGVKYLKPIPLLGNMLDVVTRKCHMAEVMQKLYTAFSDERFAGKYDFLKASVQINDLELIKRITVKDFEYFADRRAVVDDQIEPCFGRNLFSLRGQEWKDMRSTLSPAFTSSKMRSMVPFMVEVNEQMINVLKKKIKESKSDYVEINCKDLTTRYANDVIASCAFGVKLDSHAEENNQFYTMGKGIATFGFRAILVVLGYQAIPSFMRSMNVKLFKETTTNFFKDLVMTNMKQREMQNILRPDMIHLLMEAKKGKLTHEEKSQAAAGDTGFATVEESEFGTKTVLREWSDNDLIAQAVLFFVAGFETVSSTMSFLLYELALHPEVQDRLLYEIRENDAKNGGKFDYNSIQNLKYLDMVISEVLRLWPPVIALSRECQRDYNIGKANNTSPRDYVVRKGESVTIPVWPIHRDPKYFPEPEKFDPERFSDTNKVNIKPFSYMPFGSGPRNCIGSRFALCEVKVMAYQMIQNLEVSPCEKTTIPPKLDPNTFNVILKGGYWLRLKTRN